MKVWGRRNSINVQKVLWCCAELDIPFERVDVGGPFGGNRDPHYLQLNPNGLVPTISDEGFVLWEANVIVRYLAAKHGAGTLYPEDLTVRADADRWMDWQMGTLWAAMRPVFVGLVRTPPEERELASIEAATKRTAEIWGILDAHLADRDYVTGPSFTMGDIPLGATAYRWLQLGVEGPILANVRAWHERLSERPAFREHVMLPLS
ncbi:MAG TPA: glutathione S-transferase family protein [Rubrobacteraceae bacterium]|nr:glutathione S-transferase family protein [Rubrobacteraceae bacterium]